VKALGFRGSMPESAAYVRTIFQVPLDFAFEDFDQGLWPRAEEGEVVDYGDRDYGDSALNSSGCWSDETTVAWDRGKER
jgi:hypothetical protein